MTRPLRRQEAGLTYHVFTRAIRDERIYRDDFDRLEFLRLLGETVLAFGWECHAYCEMTTHYHILVTTPAPNIAAGMQNLNSRHAEYFNRRHRVSGHLFRGRYGAVVIAGNGHLLTAYGYIARDPVLAGICSRAEQWPWSSFRATVGMASHPNFLTSERILALFSHDRELLRVFVNGVSAPPEPAVHAAVASGRDVSFLHKGSDPGLDARASGLLRSRG